MSTAPANIHVAKVLLCIWRDQGGANYYEMLEPYENITAERYRAQLTQFIRELHENLSKYKQRHDKVILQHENGRPHICKPVKAYLEILKWEVLPTRHIP